MSRLPVPAVEPPQVGVRIQQLRQALRLSLDELSRRAGVSTVKNALLHTPHSLLRGMMTDM